MSDLPQMTLPAGIDKSFEDHVNVLSSSQFRVFDSLGNQGHVVSAEAEAVVDGIFDVAIHGLIWNAVQIAIWVRSIVVDRGRQNSLRQSKATS